MYVQTYKINNSYTVYVPEKEKKSKSRQKAQYASGSFSKPKRLKLSERSLMTPLPEHTLVGHKIYGVGEIVSTDEYGYMIVSFPQKKARFIYPEVFKHGFLIRV